MIYIVRRQPSDGALELTRAVEGVRIRTDAGLSKLARATGADTVVCWGDFLPGRHLPQMLNNVKLQNKLQDALKLIEKGVPTITVSREERTSSHGVDPALAAVKTLLGLAVAYVNLPKHQPREPIYRQGLGELKTAVCNLQEAAMGPAPTNTSWLPRSRNHVGGDDLLRPPARPDYWVKQEEFVKEFRVHSFRGKSIRAGVKSHREGIDFQPHSWIRSHEAGWRISYDGVSVNQAMRNLAHQAVTALGLDFGAVDIGQRRDGSMLVLEVNRAPGLEGGTITAYAEAIRGV